MNTNCNFAVASSSEVTVSRISASSLSLNRFRSRWTVDFMADWETPSRSAASASGTSPRAPLKQVRSYQHGVKTCGPNRNPILPSADAADPANLAPGEKGVAMVSYGLPETTMREKMRTLPAAGIVKTCCGAVPESGTGFQVPGARLVLHSAV